MDGLILKTNHNYEIRRGPNELLPVVKTFMSGYLSDQKF